MKVLKFGGTSVKNYESIHRVYEIIKNQINNNQDLLIVVSAMSGVTDLLLKVSEISDNKEISEKLNIIKSIHINEAEKLNLGEDAISYINKEFDSLDSYLENHYKDFNKKAHYDRIVSLGEVLNSYLINDYFCKMGIISIHLDSRKLIKTDNEFGSANVIYDLTQNNIINEVDFHKQTSKDKQQLSKVFVCGGFISSSIDNKFTTLGRGGSDFTGAIYASILNADSLEIWTDVDGILTCDPKLIKNAKLIKHLSYLEAAELAYFGAKVLHPKTILPAVKKNIPVIVKNTFNPDNYGTAIFDKENNPKQIKAIAFRKNIILINVVSNRMLGAYGFLHNVFEIFKKYKSSVDLVATSEVSISLTIDNSENLKEIIDELKTFSEVTYSQDNAIVSVIGEGIKKTAGIAARFFGVLSDINISMVSVGASEVNLSIVINQNDLDTCVKKLHFHFFENVILDNEIFSKI